MSSFLIFFTSFALIAYAFLGITLWHIVRMWDYAPLSRWVRRHRIWVQSLYYGCLASIPLLAVFSYGYTIYYYTSITSWMYTIFVWLLGASGYFLLASIAAWFLGLGILFLKKIFQPSHRYGIMSNRRNILQSLLLPLHTEYSRVAKYVITLPLLIAIMVVIYGTINAQTLRITSYEISASQAPVPLPSSWIGRRIVLVTDTHIGQVRKERFLTRVVTMINAQHPDLVIVGGDLIDGPKFPHEFLEPLRNLKSTLGNYFIEGNHEGYSKDPEIAQVIDTYLTRISDTARKVDGISLVGINYYREDLALTQHRIDVIEKNNKNITQTPVLGIIHDPKNVAAFASLKPFLTLAGHTHNGQMWPGNIMVRKIYGLLGYGKSIASSGFGFHITSSGAGTAQTPMRIGSKAEIVVITVTE
jgi:hypothetical protein